MARFQIEEIYGERIVATTSAEAPDALSAAETLTERRSPPRACKSTGFGLSTNAKAPSTNSELQRSRQRILPNDELLRRKARLADQG